MRWARIAPTTAGYYPGGIVFDPMNPYSVLMSVRRNGTGEIESWCSADNGATWRPSFRVTHDSDMDQVRPQVTQRREQSEVTWLRTPRYASYSDFSAGLRTVTLPMGSAAACARSEP